MKYTAGKKHRLQYNPKKVKNERLSPFEETKPLPVVSKVVQTPGNWEAVGTSRVKTHIIETGQTKR